MKIITYPHSEKIHVYGDDYNRIPVRPYFTHLSIELAKKYMAWSEDLGNPKIEVNGTVHVCKTCRSFDVAVSKFVNPNTNEILDVYHEPFTWCFGRCKSETTLVNYHDYVR